jgi:hypothetical protein
MYRAPSSIVDPSTMVRCITILLLSSLPALGAVPDDPRLAQVRPQLAEVLTAAARDGVPESILGDKLQEGLAKNVPPARLAEALRSYEGRLAEAVKLAPGSDAALLKAIVEARAAGVEARELAPIIKSRSSRGLDVVTDLVQRGFPAGQSARTVAAVLEKNPRQVERIAAAAQSLATKVSRAEALDAITRAAQKGVGPDRAEPPGHSDDRGPDRESSGQRGPGYQHGKGKP